MMIDEFEFKTDVAPVKSKLDNFLEEAAKGMDSVEEPRAPRKPRLQSKIFKFTWKGFWYGYWNPDMLTHKAKQQFSAGRYRVNGDQDHIWIVVPQQWYSDLIPVLRFLFWIFTRVLWIGWSVTQVLHYIFFKSHSAKIERTLNSVAKKWKKREHYY